MQEKRPCKAHDLSQHIPARHARFTSRKPRYLAAGAMLSRAMKRVGKILVRGSGS
jgi:hypothetical protein